MDLPDTPPIAVFGRLAAHLGEVAVGGPSVDDWTHQADLVIHPGSASIVFTRWVLPRTADGLVVQQRTGSIKVQLGLFPPWQNTIVWVREDPYIAMVRLAGRRRTQLRAALREAGLEVAESKPVLGAYFPP